MHEILSMILSPTGEIRNLQTDRVGRREKQCDYAYVRL